MKHNVFRWFFKLKYVIALGIFVGVIGFVGESSLVNRIGQKQEIEKLRGEISEYNRRFMSDKEKLDALKTDHEAVKQVARERYYMKTEDEDIFIVEDDEDYE